MNLSIETGVYVCSSIDHVRQREKSLPTIDKNTFFTIDK